MLQWPVGTRLGPPMMPRDATTSAPVAGRRRRVTAHAAGPCVLGLFDIAGKEVARARAAPLWESCVCDIFVVSLLRTTT